MNSRFTEEKIIGAMKQMEAGRRVAALARELGVSQATIYTWKSTGPEGKQGQTAARTGA